MESCNESRAWSQAQCQETTARSCNSTKIEEGVSYVAFTRYNVWHARDFKTIRKHVMRIAFLGTYNTSELLRGPEKVARRLADEMADLGHQVHFYEYFSSGEHYGYGAKFFGKETIHNTAGIEIQRVGVFPLIILLIRRRFDIIHFITFERFAILAIILKPFHRTPIAYTAHGIVRHQYATFKQHPATTLKIKDHICEYLFFRFSDIQFFLSDESVLIASRYYTILHKRVCIVANGVDDVFYGGRRSVQQQESGVAIVFIGSPMRVEKGFDFFLRGLERCTHQADVFVICETLPPAFAQSKGVLDIHYVRKMQTPEYAEFLRDKDIYVSASSYDPFSIAAVEAMSAGLAPIVTNETGMSRYIHHGVNGYVIAFGDDEELGRTLDLLIADSSLRNRVSDNAQSAVSMLRWRNIAEDYLRKYPIINNV